MKALAFLRCIGFIFLWFILLQIFSIPFHNANVTMFLSILIMGIISLYINKKNNYINFAPKKKSHKQIVLSILTGIGLSFFNAVSMVLLMWNGKWETMDASVDNFLFSFLFSIAGAIVEELFFRGIFLNICRPYYNAGFTVIIPTVIFAAVHFAPERVLHTFIGGVLFGYFYYYTENIYTSIIMHVVANLMWTSLLNGYLCSIIGSKTSDLFAAGLLTIIGLTMIVCLKVVFDKEFVKNRSVNNLDEES